MGNIAGGGNGGELEHIFRWHRWQNRLALRFTISGDAMTGALCIKCKQRSVDFFAKLHRSSNCTPD